VVSITVISSSVKAGIWEPVGNVPNGHLGSYGVVDDKRILLCTPECYLLDIESGQVEAVSRERYSATPLVRVAPPNILNCVSEVGEMPARSDCPRLSIQTETLGWILAGSAAPDDQGTIKVWQARPGEQVKRLAFTINGTLLGLTHAKQADVEQVLLLSLDIQGKLRWTELDVEGDGTQARFGFLEADPVLHETVMLF
jgi:hypothetical protein